jgi:hypothetical protein
MVFYRNDSDMHGFILCFYQPSRIGALCLSLISKVSLSVRREDYAVHEKWAVILMIHSTRNGAWIKNGFYCARVSAPFEVHRRPIHGKFKNLLTLPLVLQGEGTSISEVVHRRESFGLDSLTGRGLQMKGLLISPKRFSCSSLI